MLKVGGGGRNRYNRVKFFATMPIWRYFAARPLLAGCVRLETSSKSTKTDFVASYS